MNQQQNDIIYDNKFLTNKQALCVVACAGSGKTTTIIAKIKYMIDHLNCKIEDFIICTFTNNAVDDIINRINIPHLNILTFHSMALKELIKYDYKIINNTPEPIPEEYLIKYLELLNTTTYIYKFKYIFIDEYQDINQLQYNIINKWFEHCRLLLVVGDDQQNIYTFRNTSIKYILNFPSDFNGEYKYLIINYRSNKGIVDLSNAIIKFNLERIDKNIIASSKEQIIKPKIRFFKSQLDEYNYVIKYIKKIKQLYKDDTIAILCRTNKKLNDIENYLYCNQIYDIQILTIHGSKGLEFDNILIINCVDGIFPMNNSDIEEERRLFYVGCTRAKKTLLISSTWYDITEPSRFIYELYKSNIDLIDIMNFEWKQEHYFDNNNTLTKSYINKLISNIDINLYLNILEKSLIPTSNNQIYTLINIHQSIDTDININFIYLYIQRIIYEKLNVKNYLYIPYLINELIIKQHSKILKSNINKYLINNEDELLISSIDYIKLNSNIEINLCKKDLKSIFDNLSFKNNNYFDSNIITKNNKIILTKSYSEFQNKNIKSIDILQSIQNLSIYIDFINGKYSNQFKLNNTSHNQIIFTHIDNYLQKIITESIYIDYEYYISIKNIIIDKINLILDNKMLIININKPSINDYIKYLLMIHKYNLDNLSINQLNIIQVYNPINGTIIQWDIIDYSSDNLYQFFIKN